MTQHATTIIRIGAAHHDVTLNSPLGFGYEDLTPYTRTVALPTRARRKDGSMFATVFNHEAIATITGVICAAHGIKPPKNKKAAKREHPRTPPKSQKQRKGVPA